MKKDVHPKYFEGAVIQCACGNKMKIGTTKESVKVEICSNCHPFYTGSQQLIDTAGRVERFKARQAKAVETPTKKKVKRVTKNTKKKVTAKK